LILNLFFYDNVTLNESLKKKKLMLKALIKVYPELEPTYKNKLRKGAIRLRTIFMLLGKCKKKIIGNRIIDNKF